ncbi:MAG: hypothetical protein NTZ05_17305, partial [Chloroflexi bacterium]|nr:hypothetical protein [Chloroflexota bacterium]
RGGGNDILQEVAIRRWVEPHVIVTALLNLQLKGMIRIAERSPEGGAVYTPMPRAFEAVKLLPAQPASSMVLYFMIDAPPPSRTPNTPPRP